MLRIDTWFQPNMGLYFSLNIYLTKTALTQKLTETENHKDYSSNLYFSRFLLKRH